MYRHEKEKHERTRGGEGKQENEQTTQVNDISLAWQQSRLLVLFPKKRLAASSLTFRDVGRIITYFVLMII